MSDQTIRLWWYMVTEAHRRFDVARNTSTNSPIAKAAFIYTAQQIARAAWLLADLFREPDHNAVHVLPSDDQLESWINHQIETTTPQPHPINVQYR